MIEREGAESLITSLKNKLIRSSRTESSNKRTNTMSSTAEFAIAYDGPALKDGIMDVMDLGPALVSFGNLFIDANEVLNGDRAGSVNVQVKATSVGCFDIVFEVVQTAIETAILIPPERVLELLGLTGSGGLLGYLKWKRGRKIIEQGHTIDGDGNRSVNIKVEGNNNVINLPMNVYKLASDRHVRRHQRDILNPLKDEGITELQTRTPYSHEPVQVVTDEEVQRGHFRVVASEVGGNDETHVETFETELILVSPVFARKGKWAFEYKDENISADVSDTAFLDGVLTNDKRFGAGDLFRVLLRKSRVVKSDGNTRINYEIVRVLEVKKQSGYYRFG